MVLPMAVVIVHAVRIVGGRVGARRAVRRRSIGVGLEEASVIADGRAVAVKEVSLMSRAVVRIEILPAGIEPVETIGHHQATVRGGDRSKHSSRPVSFGMVECSLRCLGRRFWPAQSAFPVHGRPPRAS